MTIMHKDLKKAVKLTTDFLGRPLPDDALDKIVEKCSFQNMKQDPKVNPDMVLEFGSDKDIVNRLPEEKGMSFMRKGETVLFLTG